MKRKGMNRKGLSLFEVVVSLAIFMTAMAAFFLIATIVYLVIEYVYLGGHIL